MIRCGKVEAFDVGTGRQQLRIAPEQILEAERRLAVSKPKPARRRRETIDPEIERLLEV